MNELDIAEDRVMEKMVHYMQKNGLVFASREEIEVQHRDKQNVGESNQKVIKRTKSKNVLKHPIQETHSEETIYQWAVPSLKEKSVNRESSSSDEIIDTSDENIERFNLMNNYSGISSNAFYSDPRDHQCRPVGGDVAQPGCSRDGDCGARHARHEVDENDQCMSEMV